MLRAKNLLLVMCLNFTILFGTDIIDILKANPNLKTRFEASAHVTEGYTIEQHTRLVLERYQKLSSHCKLPAAISPEHFNLFLSLHDIGKNQAKTEDLLFDTDTNRKGLELFYSRRIFTEIATQRGMPQRAIQTLERLLHHDIIGDYLKESYPEDVAYQLLLEDCSYTDLSLQDFFDLHVTFHKLDAGSYPTLLHSLFTANEYDYASKAAERIGRLSQYIQNIEKSLLDLLNLSDDDLKEKIREKKLEAILENLHRKLYSLVLMDQVKGFKSESTLAVLEKLAENDKKIASILDSKEISFNLSKKIKVLLEELLQSNVKIGKIRAIHGANSGVLIGLQKTNSTLIPSGMLLKAGFVPFSGELAEGSAANGINSYKLSGSPLNNFKRSLDYAKKYHTSYNPSVEWLTSYFREKSEKYITVSFRNSAGEFGKPSTLSAAQTIDILKSQSTGDYDRSPEGICAAKVDQKIRDGLAELSKYSYSIKQQKALNPAGFNTIKDDLTRFLTEELELYNAFYQTPYAKSQLPKRLGGNWHDEYNSARYIAYEQALKACLSAIHDPVMQVTQADLAILANPFPIIFGSKYPWESVNYDNEELFYRGPISLGNGISHLIVPSDRVEYMQDWVKRNVKNEQLPTVLSFEEFHEQYPESKEKNLIMKNFLKF